jgi:hypothetical protein
MLEILHTITKHVVEQCLLAKNSLLLSPQLLHHHMNALAHLHRSVQALVFKKCTEDRRYGFPLDARQDVRSSWRSPRAMVAS